MFSARVAPSSSPSALDGLTQISSQISHLILEADPAARRELESLSRERDQVLRNEGLLHFGIRQRNAGRETLALAVFSALRQGPLGSRVQSHQDGLIGRGDNQSRLPILLSRFIREISSPSTLVGMAGAQAVYGLSRMAMLSRLAAAPLASILSRGTGARALASTGAFLLEAPSFVAFSRGTEAILGSGSEGTFSALGREIAASYLTLGALRASGALLGSIGRRIFAASNSRGPLQGVLQQAGTFGGIMLGHELETRLGWRPRLEGATTWLDSLATYLQFHVTGHMVRRAFPRLAAFQREIHRQGDLASIAQSGTWFRRLPRWGRNLALAPLWLMMGAPGKEPGPPRFDVPPDIEAILLDFPTIGEEATRERFRAFIADLSAPSVTSHRLITSVMGLLDAAGEISGNLGEEIWNRTMEIVNRMDLSLRAPRALARHILESKSPGEFDPGDVAFQFALLNNPGLNGRSAQIAQARLTEVLRSDDPMMDFNIENALRGVAEWVRSGGGPPAIREALVQESLALARRMPDWFCAAQGVLLTKALLTRGYPLRPVEARRLVDTMIQGIQSPNLHPPSRTRLMATLDDLAIDPRSSEAIRLHLQAQLPEIRRMFLEETLEALRTEVDDLPSGDFRHLMEQDYVSPSDLESLSRALAEAFRRLKRDSLAYAEAVELAETALTQGRLGAESRTAMAGILLEALSAPRLHWTAGSDTGEVERHRALIQSLPRSELESLALDLIQSLGGNVAARRQRAELSLTQLLPMVRESFTVRGHLMRATQRNIRAGMAPVYQRLMQIFQGAAG